MKAMQRIVSTWARHEASSLVREGGTSRAISTEWDTILERCRTERTEGGISGIMNSLTRTLATLSSATCEVSSGYPNRRVLDLLRLTPGEIGNWERRKMREMIGASMHPPSPNYDLVIPLLHRTRENDREWMISDSIKKLYRHRSKPINWDSRTLFSDSTIPKNIERDRLTKIASVVIAPGRENGETAVLIGRLIAECVSNSSIQEALDAVHCLPIQLLPSVVKLGRYDLVSAYLTFEKIIEEKGGIIPGMSEEVRRSILNAALCSRSIDMLDISLRCCTPSGFHLRDLIRSAMISGEFGEMYAYYVDTIRANDSMRRSFDWLRRILMDSESATRGIGNRSSIPTFERIEIEKILLDELMHERIVKCDWKLMYGILKTIPTPTHSLETPDYLVNFRKEMGSIYIRSQILTGTNIGRSFSPLALSFVQKIGMCDQVMCAEMMRRIFKSGRSGRLIGSINSFKWCDVIRRIIFSEACRKGTKMCFNILPTMTDIPLMEILRITSNAELYMPVNVLAKLLFSIDSPLTGDLIGILVGAHERCDCVSLLAIRRAIEDM